ncbi:hypothetical protein RSP673_019305 (plasmid) [Ralstonia solanacearum P673]|uniref:hypothetical protein n=1 Tax=Ralstonia solanacearum TaxID=305 RepID=UPI00202A53CF|nr:hypothetical protein [Ralstonia solanacearum]MCL9849314.1 hypothetical protein [Ralstonia solanacearum]MCL9856035.1 hypothetical protein [Ralstonia solanacearum]MCL9861526.1 hypothetical protein [Ralstonia solanacearum]MCL9865787.1 hypothetical protein [Ralstonia solanacearum]MCL9870557.1 hypothetical protein [Ralstonia solanacearum]
MLQRFSVALWKVGSSKLLLQRINRVAEYSRQRVGWPGPVYCQTRSQHMGLRELAQHPGRDVPQKMPGIENLHRNYPT